MAGVLRRAPAAQPCAILRFPHAETPFPRSGIRPSLLRLKRWQRVCGALAQALRRVRAPDAADGGAAPDAHGTVPAPRQGRLTLTRRVTTTTITQCQFGGIDQLWPMLKRPGRRATQLWRTSAMALSRLCTFRALRDALAAHANIDVHLGNTRVWNAGGRDCRRGAR